MTQLNPNRRAQVILVNAFLRDGQGFVGSPANRIKWIVSFSFFCCWVLEKQTLFSPIQKIAPRHWQLEKTVDCGGGCSFLEKGDCYRQDRRWSLCDTVYPMFFPLRMVTVQREGCEAVSRPNPAYFVY